MPASLVSLQEICATAADEKKYVDAPFEVLVTSAKPHSGKMPSRAEVCDPLNSSIRGELSQFGRSLTAFEGRVVRVEGKGTTAKLYGGRTAITVGKMATVTQVDSPASYDRPAEPPHGSSPVPRDDSRGMAQRPPQGAPPTDDRDPADMFHREMKRICLLHAHCVQYALDEEIRLGRKFDPAMHQATVATMFITAERKGLLSVDKMPGLREPDAKGGFVRFVKPAEDPAELEAKRKRLEAEAAERAAAEARARHQQDVDEDVPF